MAYLRLVSANDDWSPGRYAPPPAPRRGFPFLTISIAALLGLCGSELILSAAWVKVPMVFDVPPPEPDPSPAPEPRLRIVLTPSVAPATHPETWAALPTAGPAPIAAAPLADPASPPPQAAACRETPSMATQMVCVDPVLAAADRQAADALEAVLTAGGSPEALGRSQARWMLAREEAARSSPEDLLAAYQDRTRRLRAAAAVLTRHGAMGGVL